MLFGQPPEVLGFAAALLGIAGLEAAPPWGRSIPGHLGLACAAALAVALGHAAWWLPIPAVVGAILCDVGSFAWLRVRPLHGVWRGHAWWRAGLDVDDLSQQLHRHPLRAFVRAKFSTKERARLPYACAKGGMRPGAFAALSAAASAVWAPIWVAVGALVGGITLVLPAEGDFVVLAISLVTLATLVSRPPSPTA